MELRDVPGFPGYQVTSEGMIWTKGRAGWMKPAANERGHMYVRPHVGGRPRKLYLHRAVALAWMGEQPEGKPFVLHGDGDPSNNHVSNLRWGDQFDNMADMIEHGNSRLGGKW